MPRPAAFISITMLTGQMSAGYSRLTSRIHLPTKGSSEAIAVETAMANNKMPMIVFSSVPEHYSDRRKSKIACCSASAKS
jgi:hypothetical protein